MQPKNPLFTIAGAGNKVKFFNFDWETQLEHLP
jgi:hypothetical protein